MTELKTAGINTVEILKYCKERLFEINTSGSAETGASAKDYSATVQTVVIGVSADTENPLAGIRACPAIRIAPTGGDWQRSNCWHERRMLLEFDLFAQGADGEEALYNNLALQDDVKAWLEKHKRFSADAAGGDGWSMDAKILSDAMAKQLDKGPAPTFMSTLLVEIRINEAKYKSTTN